MEKKLKNQYFLILMPEFYSKIYWPVNKWSNSKSTLLNNIMIVLFEGE